MISSPLFPTNHASNYILSIEPDSIGFFVQICHQEVFPLHTNCHCLIDLPIGTNVSEMVEFSWIVADSNVLSVIVDQNPSSEWYL